MRHLVSLLFSLGWAYGQALPPNLLRYYSTADMEEVRTKTPQKYLALLYEFTDSYEVVGAPPEATSSDIARVKAEFDPRAFERPMHESLEITIGPYRIRLKSMEEMLADLRARYPEYDWTPRSRQTPTQKVQ